MAENINENLLEVKLHVSFLHMQEKLVVRVSPIT